MRATAPADRAFVVHREAFHDVIGSEPRLARVLDTDAHEGPVYVAGEHALYFTSVPRPGPAGPRVALDGSRFPLEPERLTTVRAGAHAANRMTLAPDGRLVVCERAR